MANLFRCGGGKRIAPVVQIFDQCIGSNGWNQSGRITFDVTDFKKLNVTVSIGGSNSYFTFYGRPTLGGADTLIKKITASGTYDIDLTNHNFLRTDCTKPADNPGDSWPSQTVTFNLWE